MIGVILTLSIINTLGLLIAGVIYWKNNFTIVRLEEWNLAANAYNTLGELGLLDENGELHVETSSEESEEPIEQAGGEGFFRDSLYEDYPTEDFIEQPEGPIVE